MTKCLHLVEPGIGAKNGTESVVHAVRRVCQQYGEKSEYGMPSIDLALGEKSKYGMPSTDLAYAFNLVSETLIFLTDYQIALHMKQ